MKRQRNPKVPAPVAANDKNGPKVEGPQETTTVVATNRKGRKQVETEVVEVEGGGEESWTAAESMMETEGWRWTGDEQMSWGYISVPDWDLAHSDLYNDDYWEDDLWGLKAIKEIPNE